MSPPDPGRGTVVAAFGDPPPAAAIDRAVATLTAGGVIAVPTDTVYGIAADPRSATATAALFAVKGRPTSVDLPVLVADIGQAADLAGPLPPAALALMDRFWPGPLTLVVPRRSGVGLHLGGSAATVGLRQPDHPVPLAVCRSFGPIATTSANAHGLPPATTPADAAALAGLALVLDAGDCPIRPSTVVAVGGPEPVLLREGGIAWADVLAIAT